MYGQQIREVIENHHEVFADAIKKPTIYYQLDRLVSDGYLEIRHETVEAPVPGAAHDDLALRERDVYYITSSGRQYFFDLLRKMMSVYTPGMSEIDACLYFLHHLQPHEAVTLLLDRQARVTQYHTEVVEHLASGAIADDAHKFVNDHKLIILEAELHWLERTITHLRTKQVAQS